VERLLLRPNEVAESLGISRSRAYELIAAGDIPSVRLGTSIRVSTEALREWVANQDAKTAARPTDATAVQA
jgi:prophage regulatory protein